MLRERNDTIAAIATPLGEAGLAIIRVSGAKAIDIVDSVFVGKHLLRTAESHTIHFGRIVDPTERIVDEVLVSVFRNPHSYTGEDGVEISCHGSYYGSQKILETVIAAGARMADPGEFTQRAFMNGKMDLMQAEAVADLIHSKTDLAHKASLEQLEGVLSSEIKGLRQRLIDLCSLLELELDFAEEGIELADRKRIGQAFDDAITELEQLIRSYGYGKLIRDGVKVVLAGSPNVGKSSLLNVLLQENRAIVSDIPGTTRDVIEETIAIGGIAFRLVDTAGLRETADSVEREGVRRTYSQIESADIILLLIDSSDPLGTKHDYISDLIQKYEDKVLVIFNKMDLVDDRKGYALLDGHDYVRLSCLSHEGVPDLTQKLLKNALSKCDSNASSVKIQSSRHRELLKQTLESLRSAQLAFRAQMGSELVAIDIRAGLNSLGEIIGLTTPEDVLDSIFSRFCIGK